MSDLYTATSCLANLPPIAPCWLWRNRLPKGKIVLLAGPPGSGKTFIALDLAARVTTAATFPGNPTSAPMYDLLPDLLPDSLPEPSPDLVPPDKNATLPGKKSPKPIKSPIVTSCPLAAANAASLEAAQRPSVGSVLLITPQEDLIDNIRTRLEAARANADKVITTTDLAMENLKSCTDRIKDLKLVIIDPLAFLISNDHEPYTTTRKLYELYQHLYSRSVTILALMPMHPGRSDPLRRIPRINTLAPFASIIFAASPDHREENTQPHSRVFIQLKNSLSALAPALPFHIENNAIVWADDLPENENIDAILAPPPRPTGPDPLKLDQCAQWLCELLARGPLRQTDILKSATAAGFSYRTLRRAKHQLKIQSKRQTNGHWLWRSSPGKFEYDTLDIINDRLLHGLPPI